MRTEFNGALMKDARQKLGFTLQEVADAVHSSKSYIYELEIGKSQPSIGIAFDISRFLKTPIRKLLKGSLDA